MGFHSVVNDADGFADGPGAFRDCDVFVSRRIIVLAICTHSVCECAKAKAMDGAGAFGSVDRSFRVARMGLHARRHLDLGAGWPVGVGVRI